MSKEAMKPYQIVRAGQAADVYIFGDIVSSQWWDDETSPNSLRRELQALAAEGVTEVNVHVDSYGGEISAGWTVYNVLKDFRGTVNTFADGFVASAAVYPFLAGQRRAANPMSAFFLHQAWSMEVGNAEELRKAAEDLDKLNAIGLEAFAAVGIDKERVLELERAETWLTAAEALELGLATEILDRSDGAAAQQSVRRLIVQALTEKRAAEVSGPYEGRETPPQATEPAQRETDPGDPKEPGEDKTNHLMAFFGRAKI